MGVTIHVSEDGYITYTIQSGNVIWTVDDTGNILNEVITDRDLERERSLF